MRNELIVIFSILTIVLCGIGFLFYYENNPCSFSDDKIIIRDICINSQVLTSTGIDSKGLPVVVTTVICMETKKDTVICK